MNAKRMLLILSLLGTIGAGSLQAAPVSYMGKLTGLGGSGDGTLFITSSGPALEWLAPETSVSWKVDNTTTPGKWHYEYTIAVPNATDLWAHIQCVIVEASNGTRGPIFTGGRLVRAGQHARRLAPGHQHRRPRTRGQHQLAPECLRHQVLHGGPRSDVPDDLFRLPAAPRSGATSTRAASWSTGSTTPSTTGACSTCRRPIPRIRPRTAAFRITCWSRIPSRFPVFPLRRRSCWGHSARP